MLASLAAHLRPRAAPILIGTAANEDGDGVVQDAAGLAVVAKQAEHGLSAEEAREYERHGLVVPAAQLSAGTTAALQDLLVRTLAVTCSADPPVEMPIAPNCPTNLYGAHGPAIPTEIATEWMALCRHPAILDRVQSVLGPNIILWGNQLFHKPAETGLEVPWQCVTPVAVLTTSTHYALWASSLVPTLVFGPNAVLVSCADLTTCVLCLYCVACCSQDGRYWPIHPPASCSVWVAIDEATEANGAMGWIRFVTTAPYSHF